MSTKTFEENAIDLELDKEATPLTRHDVEDSPFVVIGNDENGWVGTMGKYRITDNNYKQNIHKGGAKTEKSATSSH